MGLRKGYKQTEAGLIPKEWEYKPLEEIGIIIRGASPRPQGDGRYYGGNIPRLMVEDVTRDGKYVTPSVDFLTEEGAKLSRPCEKGTLTIVCSGTVGIPAILAVNACIHDGFLALIKIKKEYSTDYLYHLITNLREQFESSATHGGVFTNLTTTILKEFKVSLPNFTEQTAIATALSDADALISSLEKLIEKKRNIKQGAMQQLLKPKKGWEIRLLEELADVIDPHPSHRAPIEVSNGIPFLGIGDFGEDGSIIKEKFRVVPSSVFDEHKLRYNLNDELLGLGRVASIGKVIRFKNDIGKFTISPTMGVLKPTISQRDFLFQILKTEYITRYFSKIMSGSTRSSVGMIVLRKIPIPVPKSLAEQTQIATILTDMDNEINFLEKKLAKIQMLKHGMMQELLTGKTRLI